MEGVGVAPEISNLRADVCSVGGIVLDVAGTGERTWMAEISLSEPGGSSYNYGGTGRGSVVFGSKPWAGRHLGLKAS